MCAATRLPEVSKLDQSRSGSSPKNLLRHCVATMNPSFNLRYVQDLVQSTGTTHGNYVIDYDAKDRLMFREWYHGHQQIFFENLSSAVYASTFTET